MTNNSVSKVIIQTFGLLTFTDKCICAGFALSWTVRESRGISFLKLNVNPVVL